VFFAATVGILGILVHQHSFNPLFQQGKLVRIRRFSNSKSDWWHSLLDPSCLTNLATRRHIWGLQVLSILTSATVLQMHSLQKICYISVVGYRTLPAFCREIAVQISAASHWDWISNNGTCMFRFSLFHPVLDFNGPHQLHPSRFFWSTLLWTTECST
jgi:hypothetical protein